MIYAWWLSVSVFESVYLCVQAQTQALIYGIVVGMSAYAAAGTRREELAAFRLQYRRVQLLLLYHTLYLPISSEKRTKQDLFVSEVVILMTVAGRC